jgi:S1-C subfamily serine protease
VSLIDKERAAGKGLKFDRGIMIAKVIENSPAAKAGLRQMDIILKVNGVEINEVATLRVIIGVNNVGAAMTFSVLRDGRVINTTLITAEAPVE